MLLRVRLYLVRNSVCFASNNPATLLMFATLERTEPGTFVDVIGIVKNVNVTHEDKFSSRCKTKVVSG